MIHRGLLPLASAASSDPLQGPRDIIIFHFRMAVTPGTLRDQQRTEHQKQSHRKFQWFKNAQHAGNHKNHGISAVYSRYVPGLRLDKDSHAQPIGQRYD